MMPILDFRSEDFEGLRSQPVGINLRILGHKPEELWAIEDNVSCQKIRVEHQYTFCLRNIYSFHLKG